MTAEITPDPSIAMGKPVIDWTRITVDLNKEKLAAGETMRLLLEAHPHLSVAGIQAALPFGTDAIE